MDLREGGGNYLQYLKRGAENKGGDTKILKRGTNWSKEWVP